MKPTNIRKALSRLDKIESGLIKLHNDVLSVIEWLEPLPGKESDTFADKRTGPENSREEVVGTSTRGKSRNLGNSGFSGGSTGALCPHPI